MSIRRALKRLAPHSARTRPLLPSDPLWRRGIGTAAVSLLVSVALVTQTGVATNASWNDEEWAHGPGLGTTSCTAADGAFASRGEGRVLSGSLLGVDLDTLAEASGVEVTNNGQRAKFSPQGAMPAPADPAYADDLDVTALSAVNVNLGQGLLQLPLNNSTGVLGQYAMAAPNGVTQGAAGFITTTGAIATQPASGYPNLATLNLSDLVASIDPALAASLSGISDVSLEVGAVTGRATLDGCDAHWNGVSPLRTEMVNGTPTEVGNLSREYLNAGTDLLISSDAVGALTSSVAATVDGVQTAVDGLTYQTLKPLLESGITNLANGLIGGNLLGVSLGSVNVTRANVGINLSPVRDLLTGSIGDDGGVLLVNLDTGQIRVNTAALLAAAYPGEYSNGLNGLAPNTDLLSDPVVANALTAALSSALSGWLADVNAALDHAVGAISIDVEAVVKLSVKVLLVTADLATITLTATGTLDNIAVTSQLSLAGGLGTLLGALLQPVLDLVSVIVSGLVSGLGGVIRGVILGTNGIVRELPATTMALADPVVQTVSNLYTQLFLSGAVQLLVNAQNDAFAPAGSEPADWATSATSGLPDGRYDVAALRVSVLESVASGAILYLGRGSVGVSCSAIQAAVPGSPCENY